MTDIQRARDVLQRWRDDSDGSSPGAWRVDATASIFSTVRDQNRGEVAESLLSEDARLIVGTSGNPDLLDAIDAMFDYMARLGRTVPTPLVRHLEGIATAIIAADERMSA